MSNISEVDLCRILKKSDLFPGFRLHEEVGIHSVSCDLVYENGTDVYTVEAKTELNYKVFAQACRWRNVVTASYIAVPIKALKDWSYNPKKVVLEELGLGIIGVDDEHARFLHGYDPLREDLYGMETYSIYKFPADLEFWKECFERIGENEGVAGSKLCKRSTTFSRTVEALKLEAEKHPEYTLKQLLCNVPTHYSNVISAYGALKRYAEKGIIEKFWRDN